MRQANKAVIRERHVILKLEDILRELHGVKYFSKIDLAEGHHKIKLHPDNRDITTFATHKGIHRFKRLIYGIISGFECFQKQMEIAISGCPKAQNISDDIMVRGNTLEEHSSNLEKVLQRIFENGLRINSTKCKFAVTKLVVNGHILSAKGISPDPEKLKIISQLQILTNISESKSLLGMTNFCNKFTPDYSTVTAPLSQLTKKDKPFRCGPQQQATLDKLKELLTNAPVDHSTSQMQQLRHMSTQAQKDQEQS